MVFNSRKQIVQESSTEFAYSPVPSGHLSHPPTFPLSRLVLALATGQDRSETSGQCGGCRPKSILPPKTKGLQDGSAVLDCKGSSILYPFYFSSVPRFKLGSFLLPKIQPFHVPSMTLHSSQ